MIDNNKLVLIVSFVVLCLSIRDFYTTKDPTSALQDLEQDPKFQANPSEIKIPVEESTLFSYEPKFKTRFVGPHLDFLYCFSCGYKQAFEEFSKIINDRFPPIVVNGHNFAPSYNCALTATVVIYFKIALMALILFGVNPFGYIGINTPGVFNWLLSNKLYGCVMLFFVGNAIETYLISTGAFEISYNGLPIWSKLDVGRLPSPQELIQIIDSHNRLSSSFHSSLASK